MSNGRFAGLFMIMLLVASSCGTGSTEFGQPSEDGDTPAATVEPIEPGATVTSPPVDVEDPGDSGGGDDSGGDDSGSDAGDPDASNGWTRLQPRNDLNGEQSTNPEEIVVGPSGDTLLVRFWAGVEPCFGARVEVTEAPDLIEVHLITGLPPGAEFTTCIALAVAYEIEVQLSAPVGDRDILAVNFAPAPGVPTEPDGAVFETAQYLGLSLDEAEELAVIEGRVLRVARLDDEWFALTEDFRPSRVNIEVEDGIVVAVTGG